MPRATKPTPPTPEGATPPVQPLPPKPTKPRQPKRRHRRGGPIPPDERAIAQATFLSAFAECGIITQAALRAGIDRTTVYAWKRDDAAFRARYELAEEDANDVIRGEFHRRGVIGWDEPVYQGGEMVGTIRRYSDGLLRALAQSRMPEFRDKLDVTSDSKAIGIHANIINVLSDPATTALACDLLQRFSLSGASGADTARLTSSLTGGYDAPAGLDPGGTGDTGE